MYMSINKLYIPTLFFFDLKSESRGVAQREKKGKKLEFIPLFTFQTPDGILYVFLSPHTINPNSNSETCIPQPFPAPLLSYPNPFDRLHPLTFLNPPPNIFFLTPCLFFCLVFSVENMFAKKKEKKNKQTNGKRKREKKQQVGKSLAVCPEK